LRLSKHEEGFFSVVKKRVENKKKFNKFIFETSFAHHKSGVLFV
jgi:hypothetical protein